MHAFLLSLRDRIDHLTERSGRLLAWFSLGMMVITVLVVILRYLFNLGWIALQESILYLHACAFMLGAAWTLKHDGHVRVDIFYRRLSVRGKAWVDLLGTLLLLLPVCVFIFAISFDYVWASWQLLERSQEAGGLPGVFLLKSLILLQPALLILQGVAEICRNLLHLLAPPRAAQSAPGDDPFQQMDTAQGGA